MNIILLVAVDALHPHVPIFLGEVALLAGHGDVQAQQRELGEVVIEAHTHPPAFGGVALIALLAELARMDIAGTVAARTVGREFLGRHVGRVAGVTLDLRM